MANSSFSSSMQSHNELLTEEQEAAVYKSIKMVGLSETFQRGGEYVDANPCLLLKRNIFNLLQNLQEIQRATHDINLKFKSIQEEMRITATLVKAIESKTPATNQD